jgi:hypothetical protein
MDNTKRLRIVGALMRNPDAPSYTISKNLGRGFSSRDVQVVRATLSDEERQPAPLPDSPGELESIPLNQKRVMPQKPQGSDCRRRLREIKRGVCHRVADFAHHLGISEETLRKHARSMQCIKWVEMTPDHFEEAVMSPDTAKQYMR